ncbi:MAG: helix-turn-helix domain-containing protein [Candidatus Binatia bacterium]
MRREQLLSVAQVAEYLNVDKFTIYRLVTDGQIPAFKVGNQWRFKKKLIEQWLRDNSNTSTYHRKSPRRKR